MNGKPVNCPNCQLPALVCWVDDEQQILCDKCRHRAQTYSQNSRVVFSPVQSDDGIWKTSDDIGFGELREFIEACLHPGEAILLKPFLAASWACVCALVDLLESRTADPLQDAEYLAITQNIRQMQEVISRLSHRKEELQRDASEHEKKLNGNWSNALYGSLMKKLHKMGNVERRIEDAQKQIETFRDLAESILSKHSSAVQHRTIQRLRRQFLDAASSRDFTTHQIGAGEQLLINEIVEHLPFAKPPPEESPVCDLNQRAERSAVNPLQIGSEVPVKYVPWILLEPTDTTWQTLVRYYSSLSTIRREEYDFERLKFSYDFKPNEIYLGKAAFEGYVVFCFAVNGRVVLECPRKGNAIYLMTLDSWKPLSQKSKTELLHSHRREVRRVIHSDQWRYELECWITSGGTPLFET
ncbi:MAG TPA: hypothetical protein VMF08_04740 [Candidatus Sulfotelmatobacter sp.]|nr:hypothetical protein [Candidatus Sulfotelmatobacter sp.]